MASKFHKLGTISCVGSALRWCWDWNSALPGSLLLQNAFPRTWNEAPERWAKFLRKFSLSYNSATIKVQMLPKPTKKMCAVVKIRHQKKWLEDGSTAVVLEISMEKVLLAKYSKNWWNDCKSWEGSTCEWPWYRQGTKYTPPSSFEPFGENWLQKKHNA